MNLLLQAVLKAPYWEDATVEGNKVIVVLPREVYMQIKQAVERTR